MISDLSQTPGAEAPSASNELMTLYGQSQENLQERLTAAGFPRFRADQIYQWLYKKGAESLEEMTNLPKALREWLTQHATLGNLELVKVQGEPEVTQKVLFRTADGNFIESVVMRDEGAGRTSLCLSSQVGCAMGCTFCLTGFGGFQRNLTAGEIVSQAIQIRRRVMGADEPLHHIVFMGMGEPMHNLDAVIPALRLLTDPEGFGLSKRRVTVSTVGHVEGLKRFAVENPGVNLALSLNATTDTTRASIMPINKKWKIQELMAAVEAYPLEQRRRVTVEYVLIRGINDTPEDAKRLAALLRGLRCKVNLIMFNEHEKLPYKQVAPETLQGFMRVLSEAHYTVTVRWSKGREIDAACGQLAAHSFEKQPA